MDSLIHVVQARPGDVEDNENDSNKDVLLWEHRLQNGRCPHCGLLTHSGLGDGSFVPRNGPHVKRGVCEHPDCQPECRFAPFYPNQKKDSKNKYIEFHDPLTLVDEWNTEMRETYRQLKKAKGKPKNKKSLAWLFEEALTQLCRAVADCERSNSTSSSASSNPPGSDDKEQKRLLIEKIHDMEMQLDSGTSLLDELQRETGQDLNTGKRAIQRLLECANAFTSSGLSSDEDSSETEEVQDVKAKKVMKVGFTSSGGEPDVSTGTQSTSPTTSSSTVAHLSSPSTVHHEENHPIKDRWETRRQSFLHQYGTSSPEPAQLKVHQLIVPPIPSPGLYPVAAHSAESLVRDEIISHMESHCHNRLHEKHGHTSSAKPVPAPEEVQGHMEAHQHQSCHTHEPHGTSSPKTKNFTPPAPKHIPSFEDRHGMHPAGAYQVEGLVQEALHEEAKAADADSHNSAPIDIPCAVAASVNNLHDQRESSAPNYVPHAVAASISNSHDQRQSISDTDDLVSLVSAYVVESDVAGVNVAEGEVNTNRNALRQIDSLRMRVDRIDQTQHQRFSQIVESMDSYVTQLQQKLEAGSCDGSTEGSTTTTGNRTTKDAKKITKMDLKIAGGGIYSGEVFKRPQRMFAGGNSHVRHGWGTMTYKAGDKYAGEWYNDKRHGKGSYTVPNGKEYTGEWENDYANGTGVMKYEDGSVYAGTFKNHRRHGRGTLKGQDGSAYEGEWIDDCKHGNGIYRSSSGMHYEVVSKQGRMVKKTLLTSD